MSFNIYLEASKNFNDSDFLPAYRDMLLTVKNLHEKKIAVNTILKECKNYITGIGFVGLIKHYGLENKYLEDGGYKYTNAFVGIILSVFPFYKELKSINYMYDYKVDKMEFTKCLELRIKKIEDSLEISNTDKTLLVFGVLRKWKINIPNVIRDIIFTHISLPIVNRYIEVPVSKINNINDNAVHVSDIFAALDKIGKTCSYTTSIPVMKESMQELLDGDDGYDTEAFIDEADGDAEFNETAKLTDTKLGFLSGNHQAMHNLLNQAIDKAYKAKGLQR